jgi:cytochrome c-type biogenesis protein CcmF
MASLGTVTLLASFVISAYAVAAAIAGARRASRSLVESAIGAFYLVAALLTVGTAVIVHAFVTDDYSVKYVQHYSDSFQPLIYKLTAYWGGLDGSIMFWVFLLAIFGSIAIFVNRERQRELIPYVVAVISFVEMFFLFLMVMHKNPFDTFLVAVPADGRGMNPLLQNAYMVIHPPALYIGFVGMTIPYAFGMAALITGHLDDSWLRAVRRWTLVSWLFLSFGLALGMIWAYEVLGWGGYWGWDPVENAGLLPWFTATAFLHSAIVQERRGMLRAWNVTLVIVTFFLTIFGTFMTRSGVVQSVHAFGEDRTIALMFTVFMLLVLAVSFGYVIRRLGLLRGRHDLDSWVSREGAVLANNWVMLFAAFFLLFATMFPTLSEALTGDRLTVGPPFFNTWMLPIGLALLFLTGVGPLLAWRGSGAVNLKNQFLGPGLAAVATPAALRLAGIRFWPVGLCFGLCALVTATIVQEFVRGAAVRRKAAGVNYLSAVTGLVVRSKRRYGGYIVHLGIVLMFVGFMGEAFTIEQQVLLKLGQQATIGHYVVRNDGIRISDDGQKQMITGHLTVLRDGREIDKAYPGKWLYRQHEQEPVSRVAIRRGVAEDLYIVMPDFDLQNQSVSLEVVVNPLVDWIWVGFCLLALGTIMAILPEETPGPEVARTPALAPAVSPAEVVDRECGGQARR